jgi:multicomponent Na+:H+ antiporter subunit E
MVRRDAEEAPTTAPARRASFVRAALGLGVVWAGLNGTDMGSWLVGLPTVLTGALLVSRMHRRRQPALRWAGVAPFAVYFLRQSVLGGWDVARRVMGPRLTIDPGFVAYRTSLPEGAERHLFLSVISLLPGTLTARFEGDTAHVHAIDVESDLQTELALLEQRVAGMFASRGNGS